MQDQWVSEAWHYVANKFHTSQYKVVMHNEYKTTLKWDYLTYHLSNLMAYGTPKWCC